MLKAGIIGCGSIGRRHAQGYLDAGRYELAAISDPRAEALDEMDEQFGGHDRYTGRRFLDGAEMLDAEGLDGVSVELTRPGDERALTPAKRRPPRGGCVPPWGGWRGCRGRGRRPWSRRGRRRAWRRGRGCG